MTSPTSIGSEHQLLTSRTVRDIVEYCPGQVDEVWCRKIFRQILQSLELQYAMHMPHRPITPDTIVFHDGGEPLLVPSDLILPGRKPATPEDALRDDLTALAGVIHYAITGELLPEGPLRGRGYANYSDSLVATVDRCMAPDPAARPCTIGEVRDMLGIVAPGPATPAHRGRGPADEPELVIQRKATPPVDPPLPPEALPVPDAAPAAAASEIAATPETAAAPEAPVAAAEVAAEEPVVPPTPLIAEMPAAHAPQVEPEAAAVPDVPAPPAAIEQPAALAAPQPEPQPPAQPVAAALPEPEPSAPPHAIPPAPAWASAPPHARAGLGRGQRWAIAAGGGALLVALALAWFAQLRDSSTYDQVALTLPQQADAPASADAQGAAPMPPPTVPEASPLTGPAQAPGPAPAQARTDPAPTAATQEPEGTPAPTEAAQAQMPETDPMAPPVATRAPAAAPATARAATGKASYRLRIQPWGVVYVDGVDRGVSPPVKRLDLAPGRHTVRVANPNFQDRVLEVDTARGDGRIAVDFTRETP